MRWPKQSDIFVSKDTLTAFAWSAPMRDLAKQVGMSDVGLRKLLRANGISLPPQGHWNRVHAGRKVPPPPPAPARGPGETGRIRLEEKFKGVLEEALPHPPEGPFQSGSVPEDLGELRQREREAIGRVRVPRDLARPVTGLARLIKKEEAVRRKAAEDRWYWREPAFDTPLGQRKLRLLNALFIALARRGHEGEAWEQDGDLRANCTVGDTTLGLQFDIVGKFSTEMVYGRERPARNLPASTSLSLSLRRKFRVEIPTKWQDDEEGRLEAKLAEITADIIVAGEASFRQGLVEELERASEQRRWEEEQRKRRLAEANAKRLEALMESGRLLAEANRLRDLVSKVKEAVLVGDKAISPSELASWEQWALERANEIDPVRSGQVMEHLLPPTDGDCDR